MSMARRKGAEMGMAEEVKRIMGHEGPSTEEKWRSSGTRWSRGRDSIIAATFLCIVGPWGSAGCAESVSWEAGWKGKVGKVGGKCSNEEKNRMNTIAAATCGIRRCRVEMREHASLLFEADGATVIVCFDIFAIMNYSKELQGHPSEYITFVQRIRLAHA